MVKISQNHRKIALLSVLAIIPILLISNSATSFGQTNSTASNQTSTTNGANSETIKLIDSSVSMIKSGDNDGAKKLLLQAESAIEGKSNLSGAEKHIEASLKALKEGDTNGALMHAEEAKKGLA
jgi:hypothetical protein